MYEISNVLLNSWNRLRVSAVVSWTGFIFIIFCKINELYVLQTNQVYKLNKKYIGMNN